MKLSAVAWWLVLTCQGTTVGRAQSVDAASEKAVGWGLTPPQQEALAHRWTRSQPLVVAFSGDADPVAGQPIYLARETLYIYPKVTLPAGAKWHNDLIELPLSELDSVLLQPGGVPLLRARRARSYPLSHDYSEEGVKVRQKLRTASVYQDTAAYGEGLQEAFSHSRLLRRVYPAKHLRISMGVGVGADVVTDDVREALLHSSLGTPEEGYGTTTTIELADIAFRFLGRYMVGWQYWARPDYTNLYSYQSGADYYSSYSYRVGLFEHRIYGEYALFPVDRYFTRPLEWTVGAGIILARPEMNFFYQYSYYPEEDQMAGGELFNQVNGRVTGLQLKSFLHYFLFPRFSLYAGLEACFYQKMVLPEYVLPDPETGGEISLPRHEINLNQLRFRAGVSIYL